MTETELALRLSVLYRELLNEIKYLMPLSDSMLEDEEQRALQMVSDTVDAACVLKDDPYPAKGDPWADFLHYRKRMIQRLDDEGHTASQIARQLSMDQGQAALIMMSLKEHP